MTQQHNIGKEGKSGTRAIGDSCYETEHTRRYIMTDKLTAAEAVFGFAAWLTCRTEKTMMSSSDDVAPIIELVVLFCKENGLENPRNGWENNLIHPTGECSGPTS